MRILRLPRFILALTLTLFSSTLFADVSRILVTGRQTLSDSALSYSYEVIYGEFHLTLDPDDPANAAITDLAYAPINNEGLVEYSTDFKMLVPDASIANGGLMYNVNNRGGSRLPPEISLRHPLTGKGYTYLVTGWINELSPGNSRLRLHAPIVGSAQNPITGEVRYEVSVSRASTEVNIAGGRHLAYAPTEEGLNNAKLTERLYQTDPRLPIERSQFDLKVESEIDSNQPIVTLSLESGFQPGHTYELIYEAKDPVLAGAGMAAIRDIVSLLRYGGEATPQLRQLRLAEIENTMAQGNSQSGRLLRQFMYDGFNADTENRIVFDGIVPVIAGSGRGMFNTRFAMPTRTNGQHSNYLFPNDLFPFTYGESTDPYSGITDSILGKARGSNTVPKVMHIQTSNEYWLRGGSLPHTNPEGTEDAVLPEEVRFYTIGGSQHGSGNGTPRDEPDSGQYIRNPNMWSPFSYSLIAAMYDWVADGTEPPASRYPRIADGTLVPSHTGGRINREAWNTIAGIDTPASMYKPSHVNYGDPWQEERIIDQQPTYSDHFYEALVPAVNTDNNDFSHSTVLPPLTQVPLATFMSWNLRNPATGAEKSLARLLGGYLPFAANTASAVQSRDSRNSIAGLYDSFDDYLTQYQAATDKLIEEGYLLPAFKQTLMAIARRNKIVFE